MFTKYAFSGKTAKRQAGTLSSVRKNADKFYPDHAGRQGAYGDDSVRCDERKNYLSCINLVYESSRKHKENL